MLKCMFFILCPVSWCISIHIAQKFSLISTNLNLTAYYSRYPILSNIISKTLLRIFSVAVIYYHKFLILQFKSFKGYKVLLILSSISYASLIIPVNNQLITIVISVIIKYGLQRVFISKSFKQNLN